MRFNVLHLLRIHHLRLISILYLIALRDDHGLVLHARLHGHGGESRYVDDWPLVVADVGLVASDDKEGEVNEPVDVSPGVC